MDLRKIKKLIDLLEESNLAELEIREGEETVFVTPRWLGREVSKQLAAIIDRSVYVSIEHQPRIV